jgi:UDP-2-acetamido-2,6-beta-L-arabino-hexul-4-ose reductase
MTILITGSNGFIGTNLTSRLSELKYEYQTFNKGDDLQELLENLSDYHTIYHLAAVNRPVNDSEFNSINYELTNIICDRLIELNLPTRLIFTSSIQASGNSPYGISKRKSELAVENYSAKTGSPVYIFRLPNVFGKWSRPNYNSVVATFCHNIINDLPINISNKDTLIELAYIDDVIDAFIDILNSNVCDGNYRRVSVAYKITLGRLATLLQDFKDRRINGFVSSVGNGFERALYATFQSFLLPKNFSYSIDLYSDFRGVFSEFIKTDSCGQVSLFTIDEGQTRGGHYHHTKIEKFLVLSGRVRFTFEHLITHDSFILEVDATDGVVVETIPGWIHSIKNISAEKVVGGIWASEIFDQNKSDTYWAYKN